MTLGQRMISSWRLGWSGLRVIWNDKTLLAFPAVTVAAMIAILSLIYIVIGPNLQLLILAMLPSVTAPNNSSLFYSLLVLWYFLLAFVAVFMHVALVGAIHISMKERDSKFLDGVIVASKYIPSIIVWTLISYTFGFVATLLDQSRHTSGLVRRMLGAAWSVITFFAVPIMVVENASIFRGLRESNKVMEAKWGDNLHPTFSLGWFFLFLNIPTIVYSVFVYMQPEGSRTLLELAGVLYFLLTLVMIQASRSVLMLALYDYAAKGEISPRFNEAFLKTAFASWDQTPATVTVEPDTKL